MKKLAILGSTGSLGTQVLDVVRSFPRNFQVVGLVAGRNVDKLKSQIREFNPKFVSVSCDAEKKLGLLKSGTIECSINDLVVNSEADMIVTTSAGDVALMPTFLALESGKDVVLGNKESVVMAGQVLVDIAKNRGSRILPIDSEPSAIWQCLRGEENSVSRLILTASGGAFRDFAPDALASVTPEQALNHPTWSMGARITVDSATLMNKAFEVIEAHWLFGIPWDNIEVVIHPQSIIHSMVEFVDGSVKAQLSQPDMRLPIQYALMYPERVANSNVAKFSPTITRSLTFEPMDAKRYPCFNLAIDVAKKGGTWPAVLCGADEIAVELFLKGKIGFSDITDVISSVLDDHMPLTVPSLEEVIAAASWAKDRVYKMVEG